MTIAEAAQERLAENEIDLRGYRRELRAAPPNGTTNVLEIVCGRLEADSRRIERFTRMFASWRLHEPVRDARAELGQR